MARKSSKENSVAYLVEGEEFKLRISLWRVGSAANSVCTMLEFTAFGSSADAKPSRASAFWFFLSTTMVFGSLNTFSLKKHLCLLQHRNFHNSESSQSTSLEFVAFGNGLDIKHSKASAFWCFLSVSTVFWVVRTHSPKKNTRVCVNQAAINKQLFKYDNENPIWHYRCIVVSTIPLHSSGWASWWLTLRGSNFFPFFL